MAKKKAAKKAAKKGKVTPGQKKLGELKKRLETLTDTQKSDIRKRMRDAVPAMAGQWDGTEEGMRMLIAKAIEYGLSYYKVLIDFDLLIAGFHDHWTK